MTRIRRARLTDLGGIAEIVQDVWEQDILPDVCEGQIEDDAAALWVAEEHSSVVGFVSAFLTLGGRGNRRWEIDLIAVTPASRRQGLGQRLIARAFRDGRRHDAAAARAIVRVNNISSQRTFEKAGFATDGDVYHVMLWSPKPGDAPALTTKGLPCVPVDTLVYRGLWIEDLTGLPQTEQRSIVKTARAMAAREQRLNTGALIRADKEYLLVADLRAKAKMHGDYYQYIKPIRETRSARG